MTSPTNRAEGRMEKDLTREQIEELAEAALDYDNWVINKRDPEQGPAYPADPQILRVLCNMALRSLAQSGVRQTDEAMWGRAREANAEAAKRAVRGLIVNGAVCEAVCERIDQATRALPYPDLPQPDVAGDQAPASSGSSPVAALVERINRLYAKATQGPYFLVEDDAHGIPAHQDSGLAMIDTGRLGDWPVLRLGEWPTTEFVYALLNAWPQLSAALSSGHAGQTDSVDSALSEVAGGAVPLCHALIRDPLDSNSIDAWRTLAYKLERKLSALSSANTAVRAGTVGGAWPGDVRGAVLVSVFASAGDPRFVYGVSGQITASQLAELDAEISRGEDADILFPKDGDYLVRATWDHGQFDQQGRCELPPCWELDVLAHRPHQDADANPAFVQKSEIVKCKTDDSSTSLPTNPDPTSMGEHTGGERDANARRYEWLRARAQWRTLGPYRSLQLPEIQLPDGPRDGFAPEKLDAAIDAAMLRESGGER